MKTLKLFNAVVSDKKTRRLPMIIPEYGVFVEPGAAHRIEAIRDYYQKHVLSGAQLNSTFYKSWDKVQHLTDLERFIDQILHYASTYGTGHTSQWIYMPEGEDNFPEKTVVFEVVRAVTSEEMIGKCLDMLANGQALKQETIEDLLDILLELGYCFDGTETIKNKEAQMYICDEMNVVPVDPVECVRYLVYTLTGQTLLIKNVGTYNLIKEAGLAQRRKAVQILKKMDERQLAQVFNRFKPIFLSMKKVLGADAAKSINTISRLSKRLHKPMDYNILNDLGACSLKQLRTQRNNLADNATFFQLARGLQYLHQAYGVTHSVYQVRNGKSYVAESSGVKPYGRLTKMDLLVQILKERHNLKGQAFYIPDGVQYALPVSEKQFVGNVPMGTKFTTDQPICAGVYWENQGGARDLDLSAVAVGEKVGWNASYRSTGLMYSGDITSAPDGAVEYMHSTSQIDKPSLLLNNVFDGESVGSKFDIVFGQGSNISCDYMMDPNNVWFQGSTETVQRQSVVGLLLPEEGGKHSAVVLNFGAGNLQVSGYNEHSSNLREALVQKWDSSYTLNSLIEQCGGTVLSDNDLDKFEGDYVDLRPQVLERDSLTRIFNCVC